VLDTNATYLFVNSAGAKALGHPVSEVLGHSLADFFPEGDIESTRANLRRVAESRAPLTVTVRNVLRGQTIWSEARLVPLPRNVGQPDSVLVIIADVTERVETEAALRESEQRFHEMFETMREGVVLIDTSGRIVKANAAAEGILGLARSDIVGRHYTGPEWRVLRPDGTPMPHEEMAGPRAMREKRPVEGVVMGVERTDGTLVWINVSAAPLLDQGGGLEGVVVVFADVTARLRVEEEIAAHQERLRSLALELAVTEQRERRRIAQELHDRIGQALAVSKMRLDAAARSAPPAEAAAALREARALIDQTIDDTRALTFDLSPPILHEFGVGAALEWLCDRFGAEHGMKITYGNDGRDHKLDTDLQGFLFQAARELLMNVVKHASARTVTVSLERHGADIVLTVADDGVGLPEGSASLPGAGFGLFSIRERVQHLAGRLDVESRAGAGCRVTLRLPVRRGPGLRKGRRSPA
jgi:PAS domain S-box-containing protein